MTDDEAEDNVESETTNKTGLEKNLNAQNVAQAEKVKREQARTESQKKKEKDKEDR